jgi:hypothetical protein
MDYHLSLPSDLVQSVNRDIQFIFAYELQPLMQILENNKEDELYKQVDDKYNEYYSRYMNKAGASAGR